MESSVSSAKDSVDHAWRYFALHAGQRMSMFNYFVLSFGIVSAGLAGCLRSQGVLLLVGATLGVMLAVVAFVFRQLDARSAFLVKHAESALRELERAHFVSTARLFLQEPHDTADTQAVRQMWTYGEAFRFVFGLAAFVGFAGFGLSIALYFS